ncbi:organic hydroperoxide resistance protein [Marinilactibacillus psychrotolerans]|uniref:Organic hydroperoxide resistance protein n=1 Tax=Marinilactibacillus psychrotolerans TaxID=191770 RepID=A0A511H2K3_9LACT|nr:organic hydroperoxide resistance protein [Marinilactibacillus psychrotolerans]TLQ06709.1 organic hydroperoxide resistance protein [Marinilactibacillus psychrotolerans]GEL67760.1 organic hydroperoxide resistance protein 2 [Marinilactibacillus psychrotolerans]GEQ35570.1 OsmC/Ohr family protein [Marinilactibacillus psychrotolerans]SDC68709.1 peroxiredoxin, Ohr subfamily [Marinilactibacillus psychrotolerans]
MADQPVYTTSSVNTGGRSGESHTPDRSYEVNIDTPTEMGGKGNGTNPEQLFALGYSACYHSALDHYKREEKIKNKSQVTLTVHLLKDPSDGGFKLGVEIEVGIEDMSESEVEELAKKAHQYCPYSKATMGNIDVSVSAVPYVEGK